MRIEEVQDQLKRGGVDGWLLYDFQGLNPIAKKLLNLAGSMITRRWYYWIPAVGNPAVFCHKIEERSFSSLGARVGTFCSWQEMITGLEQLVAGAQRIAMEYSPSCAIPYVSRVDAGTLELVRSFGKQVVSSADLVQYFEARWTEQQFQMHQEASQRLMRIFFHLLGEIQQGIRNRELITEFSVQQKMLEMYGDAGLKTSSAPIIAVKHNSANPHYEPVRESSTAIEPDDLILIDFWAKLDKPNSVYADYTWMAFLGDVVPEPIQRVWEIVKGARDTALQYVKSHYGMTSVVQGWQVDAASRDYITQKGYGEFFIHRTGHNIGEEDHGNGANMDSLETKDERRLIPNTCFSIEPGIYLKDFGIRSEVNVYLNVEEACVTGDPIQSEILKIF